MHAQSSDKLAVDFLKLNLCLENINNIVGSGKESKLPSYFTLCKFKTHTPVPVFKASFSERGFHVRITVWRVPIYELHIFESARKDFCPIKKLLQRPGNAATRLTLSLKGLLREFLARSIMFNRSFVPINNEPSDN